MTTVRPLAVFGATLLLGACSVSSSPAPKAGQLTELDPHKTSGFFSAASDAAGRIVASGYFIRDDESEGQLLVARFLQNGLPDASYGADGMTYVPVPNQTYAVTEDSIVDSAQRAVICGFGYTVDSEESVTSAEAVLARLETDGTIDTSFGSAGLAHLPPQVGLKTACSGVRQAGGYYYMLGFNERSTVITSDISPIPLGPVAPIDGYAFLVRFDESGAFDSGFGDGGVYRLGGTPGIYGVGLRQDRQDRIYIVSLAGHTDDFGQDIWVDRLLADGTPDGTYGNAGRMRMSSGIADEYNAVLDGDVDADGRLTLVGEVATYDPASASGRITAMIWRASASGEPDEAAQRRRLAAYRARGSAAFFVYARGQGRPHALLADESGAYDIVGLDPDGMLDLGYAPNRPQVETYKLLDLGDRLVAVGRVVRRIDGEPNAAAAIELLAP